MWCGTRFTILRRSGPRTTYKRKDTPLVDLAHPQHTLAYRIRYLRYVNGIARWRAAVNADVSDGWLSGVEQERIIHPNPILLGRLAPAIGTVYLDLHHAAGYPRVDDLPADVVKVARLVASLPEHDRLRIIAMIYAFLKPQ